MTGPELVGNALCLDFANTVNKRPDPARDWLDNARDLMRWAQAAGLETASHNERTPTAKLAEARDLRESIYRTFSAVAALRPPNAADTALVMKTYADGLASAKMQREGTRFTLRWPPPLAASQILWAIAGSAAQLLLDGPLDRIGECPSCGWLFLDTSRNGRRRWCSMATCGSRIKAQRHYANRTHSPPG